MPDPAKKLLNIINDIKNRINPQPPIVVWQMGKVGSSTVYESLKQQRISNSIFQAHFLNPETLDWVKTDYSRKGLPIPRHIKTGEMLFNRYNKTGGSGWKIITLVRKLPDIKISAFFQVIDWLSHNHPGLLTEKGDINTDLALKLLQDRFYQFDESKDYMCTWFDKEIKQIMKIDVFSYPFDHEKGYTIIREDNIDLLILKTELLSATFDEAVVNFLNLDFPVELKSTNISEKKHYSEAIKQVRQELIIPDDILNKINKSRYMMHFYPSTS